jgi:hypothetical protein
LEKTCTERPTLAIAGIAATLPPEVAGVATVGTGVTEIADALVLQMVKIRHGQHKDGQDGF